MPLDVVGTPSTSGLCDQHRSVRRISPNKLSGLHIRRTVWVVDCLDVHLPNKSTLLQLLRDGCTILMHHLSAITPHQEIADLGKVRGHSHCGPNSSPNLNLRSSCRPLRCKLVHRQWATRVLNELGIRVPLMPPICLKIRHNVEVLLGQTCRIRRDLPAEPIQVRNHFLLRLRSRWEESSQVNIHRRFPSHHPQKSVPGPGPQRTQPRPIQSNPQRPLLYAVDRNNRTRCRTV